MASLKNIEKMKEGIKTGKSSKFNVKRVLIAVLLLFLINSIGYAQSHKYYFSSGILTATQLGSGKYELKIDTKTGERKLQFKYNQMAEDMYVYDLIKVDLDILSDYQRSISYLKTRTKFSELCQGKGGKLLIKVLGETEIITLE